MSSMHPKKILKLLWLRKYVELTLEVLKLNSRIALEWIEDKIKKRFFEARHEIKI